MSLSTIHTAAESAVAGHATVVDALVLGAGPAGLSVAYELQKRGVGVLILERGQTPGES